MAKKHIAIVGAGFAGLTCALRLAKKLEMSPEKDAYRIILIDRNQYQLFAPSLYEIASIPKEYADDRPLASSLLFPIEDILQGTSIVFFRDEYTGGSPENRKIFLRERGEFPYAYLVLALGAETNYFDIPGLAAHSIPLKTAHDAVR